MKKYPDNITAVLRGVTGKKFASSVLITHGNHVISSKHFSRFNKVS